MVDLSEIVKFLLIPKMRVMRFDNLGFVDTLASDCLTFVEKESFLQSALDNPNVSGILTHREIYEKYSRDKRLIPCESPQYSFVKLHNVNGQRKSKKSEIDSSAQVSPRAQISSMNVEIGPGVIIEDFCVVSENSVIERDSIIRAGSIIGSTALYVGKAMDNTKLSAKHFGSTKIGPRVEIGPNSVVDKGMFSYDSTTIGADNYVGPLCNISHAVNIGTGNILAAGVKISGYTNIGNDNWFGPSSTISHKLNIGSNNYLALGSTLLRSIASANQVVGNKIFTSGFPLRNL